MPVGARRVLVSGRGSTPGFSLTAPVLTLITGADDNTPLWGFDLVDPQEGDIIRIEWDDAIPYAAQVSFSDYELTAGDLSGDFEFDFGLSAFADGPWSWRAYHMRGATSSAVSNEVSETIATAVFSPVDLFASSEKGFWLDPSDLTSMFQISDGTTAVAADNDPVGYILDRTANAHALIHATAGFRPLYKTAAGLHWLQYDGTDDRLIKASVDVTNNIGFLTIVVACEATSEATQRSMVSFLTAGGTIRANLQFNTSGFINLQGRRLDADGNQQLAGSVDRDGVVGIYIAEFDYTNSNARSYFSQTLEATSSSWQTDGSTTAGNGALELGSRGGADFFDGKIFQALAIARELTSQEKTDLGTYFATKSGATW